ncbi:MAG: flagellar biosynthetic protein FliO [Lachnospiraceae bacterium]|nr:flagellar biosynthetic protein FliO [Lachnospiraceae bacterium]
MFLTKSSASFESIGQLIVLIILFLFVLFLAYMAARIAGGFQSNAINKKSNVKVIEVFHLSNNKYIEIVKIGEHYLALAVCKDTVTLLTELDESEVREHERTMEPINFKSILDKMKNERKDNE